MTAIYLSVQVCLVSLFARFCHITSQQSVVPRGDESLIREPVPVTGELVGEEPGQVGPLQQLLPFAVSLWHKKIYTRYNYSLTEGHLHGEGWTV